MTAREQVEALVSLYENLPRESTQRIHPTGGYIELPRWLLEFANATAAAMPAIRELLDSPPALKPIKEA